MQTETKVMYYRLSLQKLIYNFKYLGVVVSERGSLDHKINNRIKAANAVYDNTKKFIYNTPIKKV